MVIFFACSNVIPAIFSCTPSSAASELPSVADSTLAPGEVCARKPKAEEDVPKVAPLPKVGLDGGVGLESAGELRSVPAIDIDEAAAKGLKVDITLRGGDDGGEGALTGSLRIGTGGT